MIHKLKILTGAAFALVLALPTWAASEPARDVHVGKSKKSDEFIKIEVKNFQDESLGRIMDLGLDLVNGRIVEALIVSDSSLDAGGKIVAVPATALYQDALNEVYRVNVSSDVFKAAPAIDLAQWEDSGRSVNIAATYRRFGLEPYFLEEGDTASKIAERPKVPIGYVERCSKIMNMPVGNFQGQQFGKVWSLSMDIPKGRILNVVILAPGNFLTKSIVPAMALVFNAKRDALLLDDSKKEFADEPRLVFTEAANGQDASYKSESYKGPHTLVPLDQGDSYRDVDRTVRIHKDIRLAKLNGRHVEVGTLNGRVTLRGWVNTEEDKRRIGAIAIAASSLELVDNQISVGKPIARN